MLPHTPTKTPTKQVSRVDLSPRSRGTKCLLCLKYEPNTNYRRKLWKAGEKTSTAKILENNLSQRIDSVFATEIVCRKCVIEVEKIEKLKARADELKEQLRGQLQNSLQTLKSQYGTESFKRLAVADSPTRTSTFKRRPLMPVFNAVVESRQKQCSEPQRKEFVTREQQTDNPLMDTTENVQVCSFIILFSIKNTCI